jgi:hypothetical protein
LFHFVSIICFIGRLEDLRRDTWALARYLKNVSFGFIVSFCFRPPTSLPTDWPAGESQTGHQGTRWAPEGCFIWFYFAMLYNKYTT